MPTAKKSYTVNNTTQSAPNKHSAEAKKSTSKVKTVPKKRKTSLNTNS